MIIDDHRGCCSRSSDLGSLLKAIFTAALCLGVLAVVGALVVAAIVVVFWSIGRLFRLLELSMARLAGDPVVGRGTVPVSAAYRVGVATGRQFSRRVPVRREPVLSLPGSAGAVAVARFSGTRFSGKWPPMREEIPTIDSGEDGVAVALLLAALAVGTSEILTGRGKMSIQAGPLLASLEVLGAAVAYQSGPEEASACAIGGRGLGGLVEPSAPLAMDDRAAPLVAGVLATHPVDCVLAATLPGDLLEPLRRMGATVTPRRTVRGTASVSGPVPGPFWLAGAVRPLPPDAPLAVRPGLVAPLLLAALNVPGWVDLVSPGAARWVPLFAAFGAAVSADGEDRVTVTGERELIPARVRLSY